MLFTLISLTAPFLALFTLITLISLTVSIVASFTLISLIGLTDRLSGVYINKPNKFIAVYSNYPNCSYLSEENKIKKQRGNRAIQQNI